MADQVESDNGGASAPLTYEQQLAADRAAFLDDDFAGDDGAARPSDTKADPKADPKKPAPVAKKAAADDEDADLDDELDDATSTTTDADEDEADLVDDDDSDLEDEEEEAAKAKVDPEVAKRLAAVRRTEERAREQLARERQKLDAERETWNTQQKERLAKLERFEQLATRARYNVVEVLSELGVGEDDFEEAAREIYAHSKKAASDPKLKEATARSRRERELADEVKALKAKFEEREKTEAEKQQEAEVRRGIEHYVSSVAKAVPDTLPLAKQLIRSNPAKAHAKIEAIAAKIARENPGTVPDAKLVLRELEKDRRRTLRDLGIDPKSLQKTQTLKPDPKKPGTASSKAATTTTTKKAAGGETKASGKPLTFEQQRALDREAFVNGDDDN